MFGTASEIDANFYRLIHELAGQDRTNTHGNRRGDERRPFWTDQRVAPICGNEFPEEPAFFHVRCYDLNASGFSFFLPRRPDFAKLMVEFGDVPHAIYVRAKVVRFEKVLIHSQGTIERLNDRTSRRRPAANTVESALPMILVGCRFTGRVAKPST